MADTSGKELQVKQKTAVSTPAEQTTPGAVFSPAVDIFETEKEINLLADLPGVKSEDLKIDLRDNVLTLAGDVYLVLGAYDADKGTAVLTLRFNPLVNFVWLGTAFLMFGFGISMWPEKKKATERAYGRRPARLVFGAASLCLGVLSVVLAFI